MRRNWIWFATGSALLAWASLVLQGCGAGGADVGAGGGLGATPGGEQDFALFRETVSQGIVPRASTMTVPGYLAEHDLPLEAPQCTEVLCISTGVGVAKAADTGKHEVFLQIGFASGIEEATFRRDPLNLVVAFDRSGSMYGQKIRAARTALHKLVDQLDSGDRLGIIVFDHEVEVLVDSTAVTDKARLHRLVDTIQDRGATDIESALARAYTMVKAHRGGGRSDRVILMTDALPNTGRTGEFAFKTLVDTNAQANIGITVLGVGIDFGQDLIVAITHSRGGNYFFLSDAQRIATVFDRDFDFIVTPLAYDLRMILTAAEGYRVRKVYGLPASPEGRTVQLDVATLFLSRNKGAILVQLEPTGEWGDGRVLASASMSYVTVDQAVGEEPIRQELSSGYAGSDPLGETTVWFSQRGVSRTVALANTAVTVRRALEEYASGQRGQAQASVETAQDFLRAELVASPAGADLSADLTVLERLAAIMGAGGSLPPEPKPTYPATTSTTTSPTASNPGASAPADDHDPYRLYGCDVGAGQRDGGLAAAVALLALAALLARVYARRP